LYSDITELLGGKKLTWEALESFWVRVVVWQLHSSICYCTTVYAPTASLCPSWFSLSASHGPDFKIFLVVNKSDSDRTIRWITTHCRFDHAHQWSRQHWPHNLSFVRFGRTHPHRLQKYLPSSCQAASCYSCQMIWKIPNSAILMCFSANLRAKPWSAGYSVEMGNTCQIRWMASPLVKWSCLIQPHTLKMHF